MKVKIRPEDFVVEEVTDLRPEEEGDYGLYRLTKRGANTLDVLRDLARRMRVPFSQVGYGGLKDRHALTTQFVTVKGGPPTTITGRNYRLEYLGRSPVPMDRNRVKGNRFRIVVRALDAWGGDLAQEVELLRVHGLPNYFDDQRFGSARHGKGFVARELILGNYEKALKLLLATPSPWDEKKVKRFRRSVAEKWGQWKDSIDLAPTEWERRLLEFLSARRPSKATFKKAFSFVPREEMLMLMMAYQAFIWNETVKELLQRLGVETFGVPYLLGEHHFWRTIPPEIRDLLEETEVPLPSPRLVPNAPWGEAMEAVLQREGIPGLPSFRTLIKGGVFKASRRRLLLRPEAFEVRISEDELHPGRRAAELSFFLPPGAYATLVIKRLFGTGRPAGDE